MSGSDPSYVWHFATDGQATFATLGDDGAPDGGWILVANSEMPFPPAGGVSAVEFAPNGDVERAYRILDGTQQNCAGGPTPWGTWLSCEEHDRAGSGSATRPARRRRCVRPALGTFAHEAVCVDPAGERLYLTEDKRRRLLVPLHPGELPNLDAGALEVAIVDARRQGQLGAGPRSGRRQPATRPATRCRARPASTGARAPGSTTASSTSRPRATTGSGPTTSRLGDPRGALRQGGARGRGAALRRRQHHGRPAGDVYVCEDGADHDICLITPEFEIARFCKLDPEMHSGPHGPARSRATRPSASSSRRPATACTSAPSARSRSPVASPPASSTRSRGPFRRGGAAAAGRRSELRAKRRRKVARFLEQGLPIQRRARRARRGQGETEGRARQAEVHDRAREDQARRRGRRPARAAAGEARREAPGRGRARAGEAHRRPPRTADGERTVVEALGQPEALSGRSPIQ